MTKRLDALRASSARHLQQESTDDRLAAVVEAHADIDIPLSPDYLAELEARPEVSFQHGQNWWTSVALKMFDLGWMVLPQQRNSASRRTGIVDGRVIKWGQYIHARPARAEIEYWVKQHDPRSYFTDNTAILLGAVSGNTFCIDVDVTDPAMNAKINAIIGEELGDSFARVGNRPKIALIFRVERAEDLPPYGRFLLMGPDGTPNGQAIEILATGHMITAMGRHHSTDDMFEWNMLPNFFGPQEATLVTPAQLARLFERFAAELQLFTPARGRGLSDAEATFEGVDTSKLRVPHQSAWGSHQWAERDGLVIDGREAFLFSKARDIVRLNPKASADQLIALTIERFRAGEHPDRAWTERKLRDQAFEKVHRSMAALRDGRMSPAKRGAKPAANATAQSADLVEPIDKKATKPRSETGPTSFLPKRRASIPVKFSAPDTLKAAERALQPDRAAIGGAASEKVVAGIDAFLDDVVAMTARIHVIAGPTGIGKSTQAIKRLGARHAEVFQPIESSDSQRLGPMLFIVPTYSNIEDLRDRAAMLGLPSGATDDDLIAAAVAKGIVAEGDAGDYLRQLRRFAIGSKLSFMTYQGKVKAGCLRAEEMKMLQAAHVPTSGMCSAKVTPRDIYGRPDGKPEEVTCVHYATCPAILQRKALTEHDLVFLVRNFVTLSVPEEIATPRGVIIDERCFDLLVHTTTLPRSTLKRERREPKLTKKEKEAGLDPLDLLQDRQEIVEVVCEAMALGHDIADAVASYVVQRGNKRVTGLELARVARRVCGNALTSQADLTPDLTLEHIRELCARPTGTNVGEEYRFWALIIDRVEHLMTCKLNATVESLLEANPNAELEADFRSRLTKPLPDRRIRVLDPAAADPEIQLNWRTDPNWASAPLLLLDASTDEVLTSLAFGGHRPVVVHDVPVSMNQNVILAVDRRLSMKSLFPGVNASPEQRRAAANLLAEIRNTISYVAGAHAHGRVLFVMPMKLRRALLLNWRAPFNADFLHYNAVAGLDFARRHVAICLISRLELPVREVDGLVCALSYGRYDVEPLIDPLGNGQDEDGDELYPHVERHQHPMRDGATAEWERQVHAGDLARRVQRQYREMELNQGAGRGRAVHREDPVTVIAITESVPDDMIADEVVGFEDLGGFRARFWDAVRLSGGIVDPELMARYAPHLGERSDFEKAMKAFFLEDELVVSRHHRITARFADGTQRHMFVAGFIATWKSHLVAALQACGLTGTLHAPVPCRVVVEAAEEPPVDKIRQVLAALDPCSAEHNELTRLRELAIARGIWRTAPMMGVTVPSSYRVGKDEHERAAMSMGGWLALGAIDDEWVRTGKMEEARAMRLGLQDFVEVIKAA